MILDLVSDASRVQIAPELGASLISYALHDGRDILRPTPNASDAFDTACYLLVPWCNRIDGGIHLLDGCWKAVAPTHPAHPLPIHGSAAQQAWTVSETSDVSATLSTTCDLPEPFHYVASVTYALVSAKLTVTLSVTHLGEDPLPYGLGLHPWFTRTATTALMARATHWQATDDRQIPVSDEAIIAGSIIDFNAMQNLPTGLIDTAFAGWDGLAELRISEDLSITLKTEPSLNHYQVYSTGSHADFVCFEPVTHPVNAHNMAGYPGLALLAPGESTSIRVVMEPSE